jgi:hypothetical protein
MCNLERFWEYSDVGMCGPADDAAGELYAVMEGNSRLSAGEGVLLRVVFDLWNGNGKVSLWDIWENLQAPIVQSIGELMMSMSQEDPSLVDEWEKTWAGFDPAADFFAG